MSEDSESKFRIHDYYADRTSTSGVMPGISFKNKKLQRAGLARSIRRLLESSEIDENTAESEVLCTVSKISPKRSVARRGKPLGRQAKRGRRLVDGNTPKEVPESINELVSERNFCRWLLNHETASNSVKSFVEERLSYINYRLNDFI